MLFDSYGSAIVVQPDIETTTDRDVLDKVFKDVAAILEQHPDQHVMSLRISKTLNLSMLRRYEWRMEVKRGCA